MARPALRQDFAGHHGARRLDWRAVCHVVLHLAGFAAMTMLLSWGLVLLAFLALGGFSLDGLMHQLNNLTTRYVAAEPARIASFKHVIAGAQVILAAGFVVLRRHRILPAPRIEGSPDHG